MGYNAKGYTNYDDEDKLNFVVGDLNYCVSCYNRIRKPNHSLSLEHPDESQERE